MRIAIVALSALALSIPAGNAGASPGSGPTGARCAFVSTTEPSYLTIPPNAVFQLGRFVAGPLLGNGTLTCTLQLNTQLHSGTDEDAQSFGSVSGVVVGATTVSPSVHVYQYVNGMAPYLCSSFTPAGGGTTLYWRADTQAWTTNPNTQCTLLTVVTVANATELAEPTVTMLCGLSCWDTAVGHRDDLVVVYGTS